MAAWGRVQGLASAVLIQAKSDERIASSTDMSIGCTQSRGTNTV